MCSESMGALVEKKKNNSTEVELLDGYSSTNLNL